MTTVLVIDTSLTCCQAGLYRDGLALAVAVEPMMRGHQERLAPMVAELLDKANLAPAHIDQVVVTLGPGSFTGLRVGLAFAKGFASGLGVPLKGVGTLEALNRHPDLAGRRALSVIHGGRGQTYGQLGLEAPQGYTSELAAKADVVTGPAATLVCHDVTGIETFPQDWPSLAALASIADMGGHNDATPLYMRDADAVISKRGIITLEGA